MSTPTKPGTKPKRKVACCGTCKHPMALHAEHGCRAKVFGKGGVRADCKCEVARTGEKPDDAKREGYAGDAWPF